MRFVICEATLIASPPHRKQARAPAATNNCFTLRIDRG
jgi:hypothetical protein